jgi:hypothetical protein
MEHFGQTNCPLASTLCLGPNPNITITNSLYLNQFDTPITLMIDSEYFTMDYGRVEFTLSSIC